MVIATKGIGIPSPPATRPINNANNANGSTISAIRIIAIEIVDGFAMGVFRENGTKDMPNATRELSPIDIGKNQLDGYSNEASKPQSPEATAI